MSEDSRSMIAERMWAMAASLGAAASLALAAAASAPTSMEVVDGEGGTGKVVIVDPKDIPAGNWEVKTYAGEVAKGLPAGYKIRLLLVPTFNPSTGKVFDHTRSVTPVNPAGRKDGVEQIRRPFNSYVYQTISWKDGVRDGVERVYQRDPNGRPALESEIPWKDGQLTGIRKTYYPDGAVMLEAAFVDGKTEGESVAYAPDGKVQRRTTLKDGKRDGPSTDYWPSGQVKRVAMFRMGLVEGAVKEYYDNGQLKHETPFHNDRQHGMEKLFNADGTPEKTKYWLDGEEVTEAVFKEKYKP